MDVKYVAHDSKTLKFGSHMWYVHMCIFIYITTEIGETMDFLTYKYRTCTKVKCMETVSQTT